MRGFGSNVKTEIAMPADLWGLTGRPPSRKAEPTDTGENHHAQQGVVWPSQDRHAQHVQAAGRARCRQETGESSRQTTAPSMEATA